MATPFFCYTASPLPLLLGLFSPPPRTHPPPKPIGYIFEICLRSARRQMQMSESHVFPGKIVYTLQVVPPGVRRKFLKFSSSPGKTAANSTFARIFPSVPLARTTTPSHTRYPKRYSLSLSLCPGDVHVIACGCGRAGVVSLSFASARRSVILRFRRRTCTRHPVVHLDIRRTAI